MKYLPLVWAGIWRKRGRTVLIFLQVAVAFTLFGVLQGLKTGVDHAIAAARADLLIVHSRLSWAEPLPLEILGQIGSVPGVKEVIPVDLALGTYRNANQQVGIVAVRPDKGWLSAFTYTISPAYVTAPPIGRLDMVGTFDAHFANSPNETRSESIRELAQANLQSSAIWSFSSARWRSPWGSSAASLARCAGARDYGAACHLSVRSRRTLTS
ncbi:MAG TPA: hypothetical protein VF745_01950 [Steroidobacteraceae bacterium]